MTANNALTLPLDIALNRFGEKKAAQAISFLGKALPCSIVSVSENGTLVTVNFEVNSVPFTLPQITVPKAESRYFRNPLQPGDAGVVMPADVPVAQIAGITTAIPDLTIPGNLGSSLVFYPVSNKNVPMLDPNEVEIIGGPNGILLQTANGTSKIKITSAGIFIQCGSFIVEVTSGHLMINGKLYDQHEHTGVQTGGGVTGPVAMP